jgi:hypothetical protein
VKAASSESGSGTFPEVSFTSSNGETSDFGVNIIQLL